MSSICGMINFDGAPVDPDSLLKMTEAAAYSGPDGTRTWISENAGFAHLALHTTPEARFEEQPMRDPKNGSLWVADVRIDNREELIEIFKKNGDIQNQEVITDVDLLMLAYRCWGEDFLPQIYGNYAFVMWDPARQQVFAGRDFLGIRPMFYMRHGNTVYFASVIRSILVVLPEKPPLNELLIADYYRYNFDRWIAETIYTPIRRLPAACQITLGAQDEEIKQHWMIPSAPILHYKNDQEYYDHFLELFQASLKACARTAVPLGLHVSGGIDSSAIACILHNMLADNKLGSSPSPINMYYMHHANDPVEEESQYYEAVAKACPQFSSTVIPGENYWGLQEIGNEQDYHQDEPGMHIARSLVTARLQKPRQDGCRVVLQGIGGDELFDIRSDDLTLLSDLSYSLWAKAFGGNIRRVGFLGTIKSAGRLVLYKSGLQPLYSRLRGAPPSWLLPEWKKKIAETPPSFRMATPNRFSSALQRGRKNALFISGFYLSTHEAMYRTGIENGVELRYPILAREIIEFILQIPTEKLIEINLRFKPFFKTALKNVLPQTILQRRDKSILDATVYLGVKGKEYLKLGKLLNKVHKQQLQYIDISVYNSALAMFIGSNTITPRSLFSPLLLQAWMDDYNIEIE